MGKKKTDQQYRLQMILTIQRNLSALMEARGWENAKLSEETGIALSDLTKYRNIEYNTLPRVTEIAKLCEVFHVSFDFMVGLDPGGRLASLSDDEIRLLRLYSIAQDHDKTVVQTILGRYSADDDDSAK